MSVKSGWLIGFGIALACVAGACRTASPLVGGDERPAEGTISGRVAGPEGADPVPGRLVEAVGLAEGNRYFARTAAAGTYTLRLPPGRYRLRLAPAEGEEVVGSPGVVRVGPGELVTGADFVLAGAGIAGSSG